MACIDIPVYDFSLYKGDDTTKRLRYKAGDLVVDLTGYVIHLKTNISSLDKTATIVDPTTGEFEFTFARVDTESLTQSRVKYKVVLLI